MLKQLDNWFDDRTGYRQLLHEVLYERIPGGARWRYIWGSALASTFAVQLITGVFLWAAYSPSAQTAWESVFYIQFQMPGGWLLRGIHHYAAQAMVVLLALHLFQVVWDGAYKAPREINFWLGLILMKLTLGLALTGYLLPWDQKGYWATQVATKIAGVVPWVGPALQEVIVGGNEYGHYTLTRFFALHAGILPGLLIGFLVLHLAMFRKHGITAVEKGGRPDRYFWPDQVLRDAVAALAVLLLVCGLAWYMPAELGAPADGADAYDAARPEWYFLFLFQFLKFFHGETGEVIGAVVIPGLVMLGLFLMPLVARIRGGHFVNLAMLLALLVGAGVLTGLAIHEDRQAMWVDGEKFADIEAALSAIEADIESNPNSPYRGKSREEQLAAYDGSPPLADDWRQRLPAFAAYEKSREYLKAVEEAEQAGRRAQDLAAGGIPPTGALTLVRSDPLLQGPRLFARHCSACHNYVDPDAEDPDTSLANPSPTAPNLFGFGSRDWVAALLDPERITSPHIFGYRDSNLVDGDMVSYVTSELADVDEDQQQARDEQIAKVVKALSADAQLSYQAEADRHDAEEIEAGRRMIAEQTDLITCTDCHKYGEQGDVGYAPDLTDYASRRWLIDMISDPAHERFYPDKNAMPSFHPQEGTPRLSIEQIELIADWLRRDWYRPPKAATIAEEAAHRSKED